LQIAFARGAWDGRLIIRMPVAVKTVSNASVLAIPVPDQEFQTVGPLAKVHERFPARCTVQAAGWAQPNEDQVKKTEGHEI